MLPLVLLPFALAGALEGTVKGDDGVPLEGVTVYAYDLRLAYAYARTNDAGQYRITGLPGGEWRVRARPPADMNRVDRFFGPSSANQPASGLASRDIKCGDA